MGIELMLLAFCCVIFTKLKLDAVKCKQDDNGRDTPLSQENRMLAKKHIRLDFFQNKSVQFKSCVVCLFCSDLKSNP